MSKLQYPEGFDEIACPAEKTIALIGNKWTLLIIRDLLMADKPLRYNELAKSLKKISSRTLSNKLKNMVNYAENGGSLFLCGLNCVKLFEEYTGLKSDLSSEVKTSLAVDGHKISANGRWGYPECGDAEVLIWRYEGSELLSRSGYLDVREDGVCDMTAKYIKKYPAVVSKTFGKGKIAAAFGPLPLLYFQNHHRYLREAFKIVSEKLMPDPLVRVKASPALDISLRKTAAGELCVHLLNTGGMPVGKNRGYCDEIPVIIDIEITLVTPSAPSRGG
jgi:hypothetical protein